MAHRIIRTLTLVPLTLLLGACLPTSGGGGGGDGGGGGGVTITECGDGVISGGETCDGDCPTVCEDLTACVTSTLVGSADACTSECEVEVVSACVDGDGCCAQGCSAATDSDCSSTCGDGTVDAGETCDGDCPESCVAPNACSTVLETGSASTCSIECAFEPITACVDGDGCCVPGCGDSDCDTTCGDGVLVAGETCDGDCPTSCDDGDACTSNELSGRAELCNAVCNFDPVTECVGGDGCCAPGCTSANDDDCACVPKTCAELGAACGRISNGCGGTITCGDCAASEACEANQCVPDVANALGEECADATDCAGANPICANNEDFPGGFCTNACTDDFQCPQGSHCTGLPNYGSRICAPNCQADNDCRPGGAYRCYNADGVGNEECLPYPGGTSDTGEPCNGITDCSPSTEFCIKERPDAFPGGYCTNECFFNGMCGFGEICLTGQGNDPGFCVVECMMDSECRTGYVCLELGNDITGETVGACLNPN